MILYDFSDLMGRWGLIVYISVLVIMGLYEIDCVYVCL